MRALLLLVALTGVAQAQLHRPRHRGAPLRLPRAAQRQVIDRQAQTGNGARTTLNLHGYLGLEGFILDFRNDDHKLRRAGVISSRGAVLVKWADNDGNDPIAYKVALTTIPGVASHSESKSGVGTITFSLRPTHSDEVFVLTGFEIERIGGDTDVREVSIEPVPGRREVRVRLLSGGPERFRATLMYTFLRGRAVAAHRSEDARRRGTGAGAATSAVSKRRFPPPIPVGRSTGRRVLQGFKLQFTNGARHIRTLGVYPTARGYGAYFNDHALRDPVLATVHYVVLR